MTRPTKAVTLVLLAFGVVCDARPQPTRPDRTLFLAHEPLAASSGGPLLDFHGSTADGRHLYSAFSRDVTGASGILRAATTDAEDVVWVSMAPTHLEAGHAQDRRAEEQWTTYLGSFDEEAADYSHPEGQQVFLAPARGRLLFSDDSVALLETSPSEVRPFFERLPPYVEAITHPTTPIASNSLDQAKAARRIQDLLPITFEPLTAMLIDSITSKNLENDICTLTGEQAPATWKSRHSFSTGIRKASAWAKKELEAAGGNCSYFDYEPIIGFAPAIVCELAAEDPGKPRVVLSGHLDSRGTFSELTAPGGDDDGSGSAMVLNVARALHHSKVRLSAPVFLVLWTGEEQGLWGSRALSQKWRSDGVDIALMVHADMIAYRKPGEPQQLAVPNRKFTPEAAYLLGNVSMLYTPELSIGTTKACCSDQQSFFDAGFPAIWAFERHAGDAGIADPAYHDSTDKCRREGFDTEQAAAISRALYATLLEVAGYRL